MRLLHLTAERRIAFDFIGALEVPNTENWSEAA